MANSRLEEMVISESNLLNKGTNEYQEKTQKELAILQNINAFPVQRNCGIDGFLKDHFEGMPVPVKIQGEYETIEDAIEKGKKMLEAAKNQQLAIDNQQLVEYGIRDTDPNR